MCSQTPLLLRGKLGTGVSLSIVGHCDGLGLWRKGVSAFPTAFDVARFSATKDAGAIDFNFGFLTRELICVLC